MLWWFSELSFYLRRVRWQDRTHAVVSHVTSLLLPGGWHANTYCSAHSRGKSEAGIKLILSDGSICRIVASTQSVTNRVRWLLAIQLLCLSLLLWANQHLYSTNTIGVCHGKQSNLKMNAKFHFFWDFILWNPMANQAFLSCCSGNCEWCSLQVVWGVKT